MATSIGSPDEGLWRFSGMWGQAFDEAGNPFMDVIEFSGTLDINRLDVNVVGRPKIARKPGRESREGTFRISKVDSGWELKIWKLLSSTVDDRRAARDAGTPIKRTFTFIAGYDDPDNLGVEQWAYYGVQFWALPFGFAQGDDLVEREFGMTWENEKPLKAFHLDASSGTPKAVYDFNTSQL
jgi:hypothetical protein